MRSGMAVVAERDAVRDVVPQIRMRRPRLDVVDVDPILDRALTRRGRRTEPAAATSMPVALEHGTVEGPVLRAAVVGLPYWRRPALPVRMRRTDQVIVGRRHAPGALHAGTDVRTPFGTEHAPRKRLADGALLALRHRPTRCGLPLTGGTDLRSHVDSLRRVQIGAVRPARAARTRAEAQTTTTGADRLIRPLALLANPSIHKPHLTSC